MNLQAHISNGLLRVKVIPHATENKVVEEGGKLKVYLRAVPEKDRANTELIHFFRREGGLKVRIKSGARSREKVLEII